MDWDKSSSYQTAIFCNKNLLVGLFYKSWLDKGICYIRDMMDIQGNFLDLQHLINQHCSNTKRFPQELTERFHEMRISLNLNEETFILGIFPQNTSNILQFFMRVAKYYVNMCKRLK